MKKVKAVRLNEPHSFLRFSYEITETTSAAALKDVYAFSTLVRSMPNPCKRGFGTNPDSVPDACQPIP